MQVKIQYDNFICSHYVLDMHWLTCSCLLWWKKEYGGNVKKEDFLLIGNTMSFSFSHLIKGVKLLLSPKSSNVGDLGTLKDISDPIVVHLPIYWRKRNE